MVLISYSWIIVKRLTVPDRRPLVKLVQLGSTVMVQDTFCRWIKVLSGSLKVNLGTIVVLNSRQQTARLDI